jgi:hypothetical protein
MGSRSGKIMLILQRSESKMLCNKDYSNRIKNKDLDHLIYQYLSVVIRTGSLTKTPAFASP